MKREKEKMDIITEFLTFPYYIYPSRNSGFRITLKFFRIKLTEKIGLFVCLFPKLPCFSDFTVNLKLAKITGPPLIVSGT